MTKISELGEFGLIHHLTQNFKTQNKSTVKGVGDDCAVLSLGTKQALVTSDMMMQGVHFDLMYTPLKHLGYKLAQINFSDVYAMNGHPKQLVVSIAMSGHFEAEHISDLYDGLYLACEHNGVDLVGGDTCSSLTGLALSATCIGEAESQKVVYRNGAKVNDLVCVSGNLGAAYMGLQIMEREKKVFESRPAKDAEAAQPDFSGREYLLERLLRPNARKDIVEALETAQLQPTAMMDISDGLSSELLHICKDSGVGCKIFEERIPIDYQTAAAAEELNLNVTTCALNGGEDYELLFTVPLADYERVKALEDVHIIGAITAADEGKKLIARDGQEFDLKAQGFNAFYEKTPNQ